MDKDKREYFIYVRGKAVPSVKKSTKPIGR